MQVTVKFNFDPETNKISDLEVKSSAKEPVSLAESLVTLDKTSLKLNQEILDYLNVGIDQKVTLKVNKDNQVIIFKTPDVKIKTDSYRVTSKLTINVRGKNQETLQALGGVFTSDIAKSTNGAIELVPSNLITVKI